MQIHNGGLVRQKVCVHHRNNRTRMRTLLFGDSFCASRMGGKDGSLGWQKEA